MSEENRDAYHFYQWLIDYLRANNIEWKWWNRRDYNDFIATLSADQRSMIRNMLDKYYDKDTDKYKDYTPDDVVLDSVTHLSVNDDLRF